MNKFLISCCLCFLSISIVAGNLPEEPSGKKKELVKIKKHKVHPSDLVADSLITPKGVILPERAKEAASKVLSSMFGDSLRLNNADSILRAFDKLPAFGIYKDNYFVLGTDVSGTPTSDNSDAKFQVSIRHRLTKSMLPFKTYLFLTYTQNAIWDVFKNSFPFRDLNYNPTIGFGKALISKNRFLGTFLFQFEHESNGKDGVDSRSWNKISFTGNIIFDRNWTFYAKAWIPLVDGVNNQDLTKYKGWAYLGGEYRSNDAKYWFNMLINKRSVDNLSANITLSLAIKLFKDANQYLFAEFYNGYGENLLDYKVYRQRLRVGFVIKPDINRIF
ncbi:MAG: phospholipase A [Dysgonamonadaceae bacterium]